MTRKMQIWSPLQDVWDLHNDIERTFRGLGWGPQWRHREETDMAVWAPAIDVYEDKEAVRITAELPGMKRGDVKISVEEGILTLKGERRFAEEAKKENYCRIERSYGAFSRSFTLPPTVEPEKIKATMKDGVLEIYLPKKEEAKAKEIDIEVK